MSAQDAHLSDEDYLGMRIELVPFELSPPPDEPSRSPIWRRRVRRAALTKPQAELNL